MVSKVLVVKPEWDRLELAHQTCYFFVLLILSLPKMYQHCLSELIITSCTSLWYIRYNKSELVDVLVKRVLLPNTINITTITSLPERENTKK